MRQLPRLILFSCMFVLTGDLYVSAQNQSTTPVNIIPEAIIQTPANDSITEPGKKTDTSPDYYKRKSNGLVNCVDIGFIKGIGDGSISAFGQNAVEKKNDYHAFSIRDVIGDRVNKNLILGVGLGYENYRGNEDYLPPTEYLPVFVAVRAYTKSKNTSQFGFSLDVGYDIGFTEKTNTTMGYQSVGFGTVSFTNVDKYKGGLFINPSFCLRMMSSKLIAVNFSIGYEYQNFTINQTQTLSGSIFSGYPFSQKYYSDTILKSSFLTFRAGVEI